MFDESAVAGKTAAPLQMQGTLDQALKQLLKDTGLEWRFLNDATVVVGFAGSLPPIAESSLTTDTGTANTDQGRLRLTQDKRAESSPDTRYGESPGALEEIVVTAQKRAERLQDVPMSVSALSNKDIERRGLVGLGDYLNSIPGVTAQDRGAGRNAIIMRGISVDPQSEGLITGSAVGVYFGEVPVSGFWGKYGTADIKLVDIERVEVLRGPQGTLYGSSSLGGTVKNIPVSPDLQSFGARLTLRSGYTEGAGGEDSELQGMVNVPLVEDTLALRAVAYRYENAGYISNVAGDYAPTVALATANGVPELAVTRRNSAGGDEYLGGRVSLLWKPFDRFDAQLTYLNQSLEQDGLPEVDLITQGPYQQTRLDLSGALRGGELSNDDIDISNLLLNYDLGWGMVTASSSWMNDEFRENRDVHSLAPGFAPYFIPQETLGDTEAFVQELRLGSQLDGPFQFIAGVFYQDVERVSDENTFYGGAASSNPFGRPDLLLTTARTALEQTALFGEISYQLTEQFKATLGGRQFSYDREDHVRNVGRLAGPASDLKSDADDHTLKANLSWAPSDATLVYAQWAEGFRLGKGTGALPVALCDQDGNGVIDGTNVSLQGATALDPDFLDNYELGAKLTRLDGRLRINAAAYRINWTGLPLRIRPACGLSVYVNGGEARSKGLELETTYQPTDAVQLSLGASVSDSKLTQTDPASAFRAGQRLPGSAEFSGSAALQYEFRLFAHAAFVRGDYNYVGSYYNNLNQTGEKAGGYGVVNMRAGTRVNRFGVELFANNLTGSDALTWVDSILPLEGRGYRVRPRNYGVALRVTF